MREQGRSEERNKRREASGFLFLFLSFYWLVYNNYFSNISTNTRQALFRYTLVVRYLAPTAITRYRSMLPLPDLAGNAVLVWYSMLSHNLWRRGSTSYHGTPKLGVINHPTWSSDSSTLYLYIMYSTISKHNASLQLQQHVNCEQVPIKYSRG